MAASVKELILQQVASAAGKVDIPSNIKSTVLSGISDSVLGSLTQTASQAGGIDAIKNLLTGKVAAAGSPVTQLAGKLFTNNVLSKLNLNSALNSNLSAMIPVVVSKLSSIIKDQDGDGDVDLNDILLSLKGGTSSAAASVLGSAAKGILGSFLKGK